MIPIILAVARTYAPYVVLPAAMVIGAIGYNVEWSIRDPKNPTGGSSISIEKQRDERILKQLEMEPSNLTQFDNLKARTFVAKTIFEKVSWPSSSLYVEVQTPQHYSVTQGHFDFWYTPDI